MALPLAAVLGAAAVLAASLPASAANLIADVPATWKPAADIVIPSLPEAELKRRRTTDPERLKNEAWYKQGKRIFSGRCAGCHIKEAQVKLNPSLLLTKENIERAGFTDDDKIRYLLRYGAKKHPGYAADCYDLGEMSQCNVAIPLDEEALQSVQDYMLNRAGVAWSTLG